MAPGVYPLHIPSHTSAALTAIASPPQTTIRVKFADRSMLEKTFPSSDKIKSVYAFVRGSLREDVKPIKFVLCTLSLPQSLVLRSHMHLAHKTSPHLNASTKSPIPRSATSPSPSSISPPPPYSCSSLKTTA